MARAKKQNLLIAICAVLAGMGLVGVVLNLKAMIRSRALAESAAVSDGASDSKIPEPASASSNGSESLKKADAKNIKSATASSLPETAQKRSLPSKEEIQNLVKKSNQEAALCKANVAKAKAKLSKALMSEEQFKQALKLLEDSYLVPPSAQEIFSIAEEGIPADWDRASFLNEMTSVGGCNSAIHYKLLKSVVEKAEKSPEKFPKEQIRSAVRAFLTAGSEKATPLLIQNLRISLLKELAQNRYIDAQYEPQISKLYALAQELTEKLQNDVQGCQNELDCLKALPNELEQSRKLREMYLSLTAAIWPSR